MAVSVKRKAFAGHVMDAALDAVGVAFEHTTDPDLLSVTVVLTVEDERGLRTISRAKCPEADDG